MQCDKDRLDVRPKEATALEKGLSFCSPSCHALMVTFTLSVPASFLAQGSSDQSPQDQRVHIGGLVEGCSGSLLLGKGGGGDAQSDSTT